MKPQALVLAFAVLLSGCTTFSGVEPIYPPVLGMLDRPPSVADLQPTFKWRPVPGATAYDLIVYRAIRTESLLYGVQFSPGEEVYYREGLTGSQHRLEVPLDPGQFYFWSLRSRRAGRAYDWSLYDYSAVIGTVYIKKEHAPFMFRTPKEASVGWGASDRSRALLNQRNARIYAQTLFIIATLTLPIAVSMAARGDLSLYIDRDGEEVFLHGSESVTASDALSSDPNRVSWQQEKFASFNVQGLARRSREVS